MLLLSHVIIKYQNNQISTIILINFYKFSVTAPKKLAASSLSRALGALQLRRSGTSPPAATASSKPGSEDSKLNVKTAPVNKNSGLVAPTLVINPGKTILPPGKLPVYS